MRLLILGYSSIAQRRGITRSGRRVEAISENPIAIKSRRSRARDCRSADDSFSDYGQPRCGKAIPTRTMCRCPNAMHEHLA